MSMSSKQKPPEANNVFVYEVDHRMAHAGTEDDCSFSPLCSSPGHILFLDIKVIETPRTGCDIS